MTGLWTDTINYGDNSITNEPWWVNIPGDGKYDQSAIPGRMDLQVGRVDFFNMTAFAPSGLYEGDLLRRYLNKDHDFRNGIFTVPSNTWRCCRRLTQVTYCCDGASDDGAS